MSNYAVVFAGGFFGTFLVHFINQHENFSKGEYVANYKHWSDGKTTEDSPVHLNMPRHSLYYGPHMFWAGEQWKLSLIHLISRNI